MGNTGQLHRVLWAPAGAVADELTFGVEMEVVEGTANAVLLKLRIVAKVGALMGADGVKDSDFTTIGSERN